MLKLVRSEIPTSAGVYIYKNNRDEIIYVGKAKNLRNRVMSYFTSKHETSPKTQFLVQNIASYEIILVDTEVEALLLENKLIKKHIPKYNINLKDSKTYAYLKITDERIPKIMSTRKVTKTGTYFGPYIDNGVRVQLLTLCVSLFKLVTPKTFSSKSKLFFEIGVSPAASVDTLDLEKYMVQVKKTKDFLAGKNVAQIKRELEFEMEEASKHMKFELALERRNQLETLNGIQERQKVDTLKNYDQDVVVIMHETGEEQALIQLFHISRGVISGKKEYLLDYQDDLLEEFLKMYYSKNLAPSEILINEKSWDEETQISLESYLSTQRGSKVELRVPLKGEKKALVELVLRNAKENYAQKNVLQLLKKEIRLKSVPKIIECFDMSNLSFEFLVGGMTRFVNMQEDKDGYRKFEIKSFIGKNDDYGAMREVLLRRYSRILENKKRKKQGLVVTKDFELPDLVVIDGGLGHFETGRKVFEELGIVNQIDFISIAKGEKRDRNEIYTVHDHEPFIFDDNSSMMLFLRKVRDSVHNYVINYNRKKRDMKLSREFEKAQERTL
jgi:excinuclease ABC subunit C